ncbi:hypothetical protein ABZ848_40230 [Streptomyces sp. NPDC047081]|uniref:hypothetical protein n=1 Tax=Streptomyces sp. NPDC047081 TaxID=3154706 RepID=UPI0033C46778
MRRITISLLVAAANDPNHLLGRPGQYTSKVTFTDSRIKAGDVSGTEKGAVERGGAVHGTVLVRVSHYLTPEQAAEYKAATNSLG